MTTVELTCTVTSGRAAPRKPCRLASTRYTPGANGTEMYRPSMSVVVDSVSSGLLIGDGDVGGRYHGAARVLERADDRSRVGLPEQGRREHDERDTQQGPNQAHGFPPDRRDYTGPLTWTFRLITAARTGSRTPRCPPRPIPPRAPTSSRPPAPATRRSGRRSRECRQAG